MKILCSTYVGGDRYIRQNMHETTAISNKVRYSDIFLTMKCSPQCPEIRMAWLLGQSATNRSDLAARVVRIKLKALIAFIIDEKEFGHVEAYVSVIEFQNRGLPRARFIFFMTPESNVALLQPEFAGFVISTEIPIIANSTLCHYLLKQNMQNLCGTSNPTAG